MTRSVAPFGHLDLRGLDLATRELASFAVPFVSLGGETHGILLAIQEVINDLFDGFLSEEDRSKLSKDGRALELKALPHPPPVELVALDVPLPLFDGKKVKFPAWLVQSCGVMTWGALAHETSGHAVLEAYGLREPLQARLIQELGDSKSARLWETWFEESASDCLAVLNLGPAMAVGSIASWRAYGWVKDKDSLLPREPLEPDGLHPPPVLRAYQMAHVVGMLGFRRAKQYSAALKREIRADIEASKISERQFKAAEIFANILIREPQDALNGYTFLDLQDWLDTDEHHVREIRKVLLGKDLPASFANEHYAAHAVAAAILESIGPSRRDARETVAPNLIRLLTLMHESARGQKTKEELNRTVKRESVIPQSKVRNTRRPHGHSEETPQEESPRRKRAHRRRDKEALG